MIGTLLLGVTAHSFAAQTQPDQPIATLRVEGNFIQMRFGGDVSATRMVLDFDGPIRLIKSSAPKPSSRSDVKVIGAVEGDALTIALDFLAANKPGALPTPIPGRGLIAQARWTKSSGEQFAIALIPSRASTIMRQFVLPPSAENRYWRFVIDLAPSLVDVRDRESTQRDDREKGSDIAQATRNDIAGTTRLTGLRVARKPVIVLDPGHGGKDPGASSAAGTLEKDVVFDTASALSKLLLARGYDVRLTRGRDEFRSLEQRVRFSREVGADLFLSLHADAGPRSETRGASVYTLSDRGGERAKLVKENANWSLGFEDVDRSKEVTGILLDLAQRETRNRSAQFAGYLMRELKAVGPILDNSHRDAGFFVLLAPDVPAALLEMGFITNQDDEKRLRSSLGQRDIALAAADAVDQYFANLGDAAGPKLQAYAAGLP